MQAVRCGGVMNLAQTAARAVTEAASRRARSSAAKPREAPKAHQPIASRAGQPTAPMSATETEARSRKRSKSSLCCAVLRANTAIPNHFGAPPLQQEHPQQQHRQRGPGQHLGESAVIASACTGCPSGWASAVRKWRYGAEGRQAVQAGALLCRHGRYSSLCSPLSSSPPPWTSACWRASSP